MAVPASVHRIFPPQGANINYQTPPQGEYSYRYYRSDVPFTPLLLFMTSLTLMRNDLEQRFANANIEIRWADARVQFNINYGMRSIHSNFFSLANAAEDFTRIMEDKDESFDVEEFQSQAHIDVRVTISFSFVLHVLRRNYRQRMQHVTFTEAVDLIGQNRDRPTNRYVGVGAYLDIKKKMFHKRDLPTFFEHTDVILKTTETLSQLCFIMAFMKCQLRILHTNTKEDNIIETSSEDLADNFITKNQGRNISYLNDGEPFNPFNFPSFNELHPNDTNDIFGYYRGRKIAAVFNPYKKSSIVHEDGFDEKYSDRGDHYNGIWIMAATDLHIQVETYLNEAVDYNDLPVVAMAYSKFFRVHIHIYDLLGYGRRICTYVDPEVTKYNRHVHMLVKDGHCSAITNIRKFLMKTTQSGKMSIHNLCDICGYTSSDSVNKEKMFKHINSCKSTNPQCRDRTIVKFYESLSARGMQKRFYNLVSSYTCTDCEFTDKICFKKPSCYKNGHPVSSKSIMECTLCKDTMKIGEEGLHLCYIKCPTIKASGMISNNSINYT